MSAKTKTEEFFKKGDRVKARWSGSNIFYDAKIVDVAARSCKVQFDDGSISSLKFTDLKRLKSDDPSPKVTRSRSRSAGRQTRSRSRSPAREKKPLLKNEKKTPSKAEKKKSEEKSNSNSVQKDEVDKSYAKGTLTREKISSSFKDDLKANVTSVTTNSYASKEVLISQETREVNDDANKDRLRTSARVSALVQSSEPTRPLADLKAKSVRYDASFKDDAKYSDDESEEEEITKVTTISRSVLVFNFCTTLLRIILMPTALLFLVFACTRKQCTVLEVPQFYSRWKDFWNSVKVPCVTVLLFHILMSLLSLIPIGKKVMGFPSESNKRTQEYRLNGIFCLLFSILIFGMCSYYGIYMNWGFDKFKSITISCLIYSVICSLVLHIISLLKGNGIKQSNVPLLGNFYNGVYVNPLLFGKFDVKTTFIRAGLIGSVLMNLSILLKYFLMKGHITIPLMLTTGMQIFTVLDLFIREEKMLSTATYTSDSVGYAFVLTFGFLIPMGLSLQNIYLFIFEAKASVIPHWCSAAMLGLFFCGYYIYMSAGNLKHNFRRSPFIPSLSGLESIPTSKKKRLIASGLWGIVRHPNYLGLLIMVVSWTLPCGFSHFVPFGPLVMFMIALVVRIVRVEAECKEKYGPAWNNYTTKVRSRLIPYIF